LSLKLLGNDLTPVELMNYLDNIKSPVKDPREHLNSFGQNTSDTYWDQLGKELSNTSTSEKALGALMGLKSGIGEVTDFAEFLSPEWTGISKVKKQYNPSMNKLLGLSPFLDTTQLNNVESEVNKTMPAIKDFVENSGIIGTGTIGKGISSSKSIREIEQLISEISKMK